MKKKLANPKTLSFLGLFFVVIVWGISPQITVGLYKYYSPTARLTFSEAVLLITYLIITGKRISWLNREYIKVGAFTGLFLAFANITQKIGLMYTTPAKYAFLENLSCISVPVLMYFFVKKKPTGITFLSCALCLLGVFILNGISIESGWGVGELLCALSGILYGFNIAGTAAFAKKMYAPLYLAVQATVGFAVSLIFTLILDAGNIEKIFFTMRYDLILLIIIVTVVSSAICWIIRTNVLKHISANTVTVIMPFSAVITSLLSAFMGTDTLSLNIILGGGIGIAAIILASFDKN